jgi:hypothetical protein
MKMSLGCEVNFSRVLKEIPHKKERNSNEKKIKLRKLLLFVLFLVKW